MNSELPGFYKMPLEKRVEILRERADLNEEEVQKLKKFGALPKEDADGMIENVVSSHALPLGIATNLKVNGRDYLVPMATEESSVVAACSHGAKLTRSGEGISVEASKSMMIGQVQLNGVKNVSKIRKTIKRNEEKIKDIANEQDSTLVKLGGGLKEIELRDIKKENTVVLHVIVDVRDAMGANTVNTMCESVAPFIEEVTDGSCNLRILSNLADRRTVRAEAEVPFGKLERDGIGGKKVAEGIVDAYEFAEADPYRAATHNKGIMNGMDAVCIATGNDFRALEAGVHSYAGRGEGYDPLTEWWIENEKLKGRIEVPIQVGTVGGITSIHPTAKISHKILGVDSAQELAELMASVGLVQNLAALRALATEGIQKGHMKLHAKNLAKQAGAKGKEVDKIVERMVEEDQISQARAEEILEGLR